eukprot:2041834-Pleurochrysis_carterae.AAC.1
MPHVAHAELKPTGSVAVLLARFSCPRAYHFMASSASTTTLHGNVPYFRTRKRVPVSEALRVMAMRSALVVPQSKDDLHARAWALCAPLRCWAKP